MTRYRIDPDRSQVWIDARSNLHPIHSTSTGLEGHIDLELGGDGRIDLATTPEARLSLPVRHLSSGNRLEDGELYKRIDARRYPTIIGVLDRMDPVGGDGAYRVRGDITFRGVSRPHEDKMTVRVLDETTIELAGASRFDIREFGMEPPRVLMLRVEPEVDVRVAIVATKEE